ncbi:MAG TPA: PQ-loop domain-containing transporter [Acidimicrobiales bacterium]
MTAADIAVVVASVLAVGSLMPQATRLLRTRDVVGVSVLWTALGVVTNLAWFAYALARALWAGAPATLATASVYCFLFLTLVRFGAPARSAVFGGVTWAAFLTASAVAGGWSTLGAVLGVSYGVQVAPSLWTAWRTYAPTGIAPGTWLLFLAQVLLWGYYGIVEHDWAIKGFALIGIGSSLLMLLRWATTRTRCRLVLAAGTA